MAEAKPAASSTIPQSSCERIIAEFQMNGRPGNPANVVEGSVLGGFEIKTPMVGDGFIEWAIKGYDLEGKIKQPVTEPCNDPHGDWMFDKIAIQGDKTADSVYDNGAYLKKEK